MNTNLWVRRRNQRVQALLAAGVLAAGLCLAATPASASVLTIHATVGGTPSGGNTYENFNSITGTTTTTTSTGITVSFGGSSAPQSNAPGIIVSANQSTLFDGTSASGTDPTVALVAGGGSVTLVFPSLQTYLGLLWGSVDAQNTLTLYNGTQSVDVIMGGDVASDNNTYYVNIDSTEGFNKAVFNIPGPFEFDDVAFTVGSDTGGSVSVPEPGSAGIFLLGLMLVGSGYWLRRRKRV